MLRLAVLRLAAARGAFGAAVLAFRAAGLRADARVAPVAEDLARDAAGFLAVLARVLVARFAAARFGAARFAVDRAAVERVAVDRFAVARFAVARFAVVLRAPPRFAPVDAGAAAADDPSPALHFPDMTRCAASATASAMIEPSLDALETIFEAVSAASSPASRILRRAAGLALIAAAAAARPAASISLLIAAFANLSTVSFRELEEREPVVEVDEVLREDLAIVFLPPSRQKRSTAVTVPQ